MRTRFRKVWCPQCSSMQFAGECGHPARVEAPPGNLATVLALAERRLPSFRTYLIETSREAFRGMPDELLHKMGLRRL